MKNMKKYTRFAADSWSVTAFLICLFPPLGFIPLGIRAFLERKLHQPRKDYILGPAIAVLLVCSMELALLTLILRDVGALVTVFIFAPGLLWGSLMLVLRRVWQERDARERLAATIIFRGHVTDLDKLGECLCMTGEEAASYLEKLIARGVLKNCAVDRASRKLQVDAPWASVRYCCPNCGGEQIVDLGVRLTCQYCGSALEIQ